MSTFEERVKARIAARQALGMSADEKQEFDNLKSRVEKRIKGWKPILQDNIETKLESSKTIKELKSLLADIEISILGFKARLRSGRRSKTLHRLVQTQNQRALHNARDENEKR